MRGFGGIKCLRFGATRNNKGLKFDSLDRRYIINLEIMKNNFIKLGYSEERAEELADIYYFFIEGYSFTLSRLNTK